MAKAYTDCNYEYEEEVHKNILRVEQVLKDVHSVFQEEIGKQVEVAERLWVLSQRYMILKRGVSCLKQYPAEISEVIENEIFVDFQQNLNKIVKSNDFLKTSLDSTVPHCQAVDDLTKRIDLSVNSPFIRGDCNQKPVFFYIEIISDMFGYFKSVLSRIRCCANLINISNAEVLENYKKLLKPSAEFKEYFDVSLSYCKCLKIK